MLHARKLKAESARFLIQKQEAPGLRHQAQCRGAKKTTHRPAKLQRATLDAAKAKRKREWAFMRSWTKSAVTWPRLWKSLPESAANTICMQSANWCSSR